MFPNISLYKARKGIEPKINNETTTIIYDIIEHNNASIIENFSLQKLIKTKMLKIMPGIINIKKIISLPCFNQHP